MNHDSIKARVCAANREIDRARLAILTWGNASEADREAGVFAIKPSGIEYADLTPEAIPLVSLETGEKISGTLNPSSDTPTHWALYRAFPSIGGIVHTHSPHATAWAQAQREIPCLGTTHADAFRGPIPCTRPPTREEVEGDYESNVAKTIRERFERTGLRPEETPGVLVAAHAPFVWGGNAMEAVTHARILEEIAKMATMTLRIAPDANAIDPFLQERHYSRKHGKRAYYGQRE